MTRRMQTRHLFGPLPTRRLGRSLGIDTVPSKTCNWNCVYCQLGRTHPLSNVRREFYPSEAILAEVRTRLAGLPSDAVDWITFVASGEGTLHRDLGRLVRAVKGLSDHPVAVITNGSLLHLAEMREELAAADAVLPTLDAGDAKLFRQINRPHRQLSFEQHVAGIEAFARMKNRGRLWIEVMLVAGLNDSDKALHDLAKLLKRIRPDEVHVTLPARCPVEAWVHSPSPDRIRSAERILGAQAKLAPVTPPAPDTTGQAPAADELVAVVTRHPLREEHVVHVLNGPTRRQVAALISRLLAEHRIQRVKRHGYAFIAAADLRYPRVQESR